MLMTVIIYTALAARDTEEDVNYDGDRRPN